MVSGLCVDGSKLYSISTDKTYRVRPHFIASLTFKIWDLDTNLLAHTIEMEEELLCLAVHERFVAIGMDNGTIELRVR